MSRNYKETYVQLMTENLPTLRAKLHLSQSELAEFVGVTRQQIVAIENLKRKMSWSLFLSFVFLFSSYSSTCDLLDFLGISSKNLFGQIEESEKMNHNRKGR